MRCPWWRWFYDNGGSLRGVAGVGDVGRGK